MLHLIAYDVSNPKRLRQVAKICEDYGVRIEYSVFECHLTENYFKYVWQLLDATIDKSEDSLISYSLCSECEKKINSSGIIKREKAPDNSLFIL